MCMVTDTTKAQGASLSGLGEYGWGGLASTSFSVDPVKGFTMVFLTQVIPSSAYPARAQLRWLSHWAMEQYKEQHNHKSNGNHQKSQPVVEADDQDKTAKNGNRKRKSDSN